MWFSRAATPAAAGPCAATTAPFARCCVAWRVDSKSASTTLPTWVLTCTSCCGRDGARFSGVLEILRRNLGSADHGGRKGPPPRPLSRRAGVVARRQLGQGLLGPAALRVS